MNEHTYEDDNHVESTENNDSHSIDEIEYLDLDEEQLSFFQTFENQLVDWDQVIEEENPPLISSGMARVEVPDQIALELQNKEKEEKILLDKSKRLINEFLKAISAKLLKWLLFSIIALYVIDLIVVNLGVSNSDLSERLFSLFYTLITSIFGYLIGSNQNKD